MLPPGVPTLRQRRLQRGERWIFSAGFNVRADLGDTHRIDVELPDLARLTGTGARVALLSHQGSHASGTCTGLEHVARYIGAQLARPVAYEPRSASEAALDRASILGEGQIALLGNTRIEPDEEANGAALGHRYAQLGRFVAVAGFSKAHRRHASNVGVLAHRPGYLASSVAHEVGRLGPWAGARSGTWSVAVLGGTKPEKVRPGLDGLTRAYDVVVPGGAVLATLLAADGREVGQSVRLADPDSVAVARTVMSGPRRARVALPAELVVAQAERGIRRVPLDGVTPDEAIVDFVPDTSGLLPPPDRADQPRRALVAGTPCRHTSGFRRASSALLAFFARHRFATLLVGGDTVAELPFAGPTSTGGGAALTYLVHGTLPMLEALAPREPGG